MKPLKQIFYTQDTVWIAEKLLGCYLVRKTKKQTLIGRIVETEAYLGLKDSSCHSFNGILTDRTKTMYLKGGYSYVYFTYGMYYCFNVVTRTEREPEAVLIRALEPIAGFEEMKKNRKKDKITELCSGPGKLCQAFNITKFLNAKNLTQDKKLYISKGENTQETETDTRIGLSPYKDSAYWPLRFYIKESPFVSLRRG